MYSTQQFFRHWIGTSILVIIICLHSKADKTFVADDVTYEENIKSVMLYPTYGSDSAALDMDNSPIISLDQSIHLRLEFDEMGSDYKNYFLKIINCNADWSVSQLNSIMYLNEYNEYQLFDKQASFNTRMPYIHYKIFLPKVKVSGNYIAMIYRDGDANDFILTKRFVVYESRVTLNMMPKFPVDVNNRNTGQQIDFTLNYAAYNLINPMQSLKVILRQNYRWDNAITNMNPSFLNESSASIEYYFYNNESTFKGGNEFRYFDIRSNRFKGMNVAKATFDQNKTEIILANDINRSTQPYSLYSDYMDGKFIIQNYETGDSETQPDYVFVTFLLNIPKVDGSVFVLGGLTNWRRDKNYEMIYNTAINKYVCRVLLKQGQYNYCYAMNSGNGKLDNTYLEGSYNITQNVYDILVYYRPIGTLSDQVIGYSSVNYQGR